LPDYLKGISVFNPAWNKSWPR